MPTKTLDKHALYRLARIGAMARLQELEAEAAAIRKAFPGLKKAQAIAPTLTEAVAKPKAKKRKKMSAEARKAIGDRMKAYWAAKRQAQAQPASKAKTEPAPKPKKTAKKAVIKNRKAVKK